jgi:hypothetical protein
VSATTATSEALASRLAAAVPAELRQRAAWVLWRSEERGGKETKVPLRVSDPSRRASSTDPASWASFEQALAAVGAADGLGFVFSSLDGFCGVDLDGCLTADGELEPRAAAIVERLDSYTEMSPSGRGVHVLVKAELNGSRSRGGGLEIYDKSRFFTVSGQRVGTRATVEARQAQLDALVAETFPKVEEAPSSNGAPPRVEVLPDDHELLERAFAAKNGAKVEALFRGELNGHGSHSEADLALCSALAFYTGPNAGRLDRLFRESGLMREKWNRDDYRQATIAKALERSEFYEGPQTPPRTAEAASDGGDATGPPDSGRREKASQSADAAQRPMLPFLSPAEVRASTPAEPPWLWNGYIAKGAVTLLAGKPKAGKSTLALAITDAVAAQAPAFLGRSSAGGGVVYVSEEGATTLSHKLPSSEDVRVLTRDVAWPKPTWIELVEATVAEAERTGAGMIVIDTLSFWGALPAEREKDAGAAQDLMEPLVRAARADLAVLLVHHGRKGGGEDGEGVRGSTAIAGAADIILELERPRENATPHQRVLLALSRYPQTPGALMFDHDAATGAWGVLGEAEDRSGAGKAQRRAEVLGALGSDELTRADLTDLLGDAREWKSTLDELVGEGAVERSGAGKKGDPHRWRRMLCENAVGASPQNPTERASGAVAVSAVCPVRTRRNTTRSTAPRESCETTESSVVPSPGEVWLDRDVPDHNLHVLEVIGDHAKIRAEASNGDTSDELLDVPLGAFGDALERVQ